MGAKKKQHRLIKVPEWFAEPEKRFTTPSSFLRREFAAVTEAQTYAQSLDVNAALGGNLHIANIAVEFLARLAEAGAARPKNIVVDAKAFAVYGSKARLIPAKTVEAAIYINPVAATWKDPVQASAQSYTARFWSTPHPLHPLFHEAGHVMLGTFEETQRQLMPRQKTLAVAVSTRAKEDAEEFVCEVFAGLLSEVEYDADIMRLYKHLGGKRL